MFFSVVLGVLNFEKQPWLNRGCIPLTIWHNWLSAIFTSFAWTYWIFRLRGNHLDFPELMLMVASDRLIHDLEAVIKEKRSCSWNPGTFFTNYPMGAHFQVKLRSEACHLDFQNYIPQQAVWKELLWNMHNMKVSGGVCVLKIAGKYSLTGALKTHALLFQFFFQTKLR